MDENQNRFPVSPFLYFKYPVHCLWVHGIRSQTIKILGRKYDHAAAAIAAGARTPDIAVRGEDAISTSEMTDEIIRYLS